MKDFSEILQQKPKQIAQVPQKPKQLYKQPKTLLDQIKDKFVKISGPIALTVFTGPFNTASILLQVSEKSTSDAFSRKIQAAGESSKLIRTGIMGDNKIYRPFQFKGYHDCLTQLGKQGLKGLYKGNLIGILLNLVNSKIRTRLYDDCNKFANFSDQWKSNILTILTCTVADFITLPLMFCQTRLVLQNNLSNYRTYQSVFDVFRNTHPKQWLSGASVLLFKNIIFSYSWVSFFKNAPVQSFILSTVLSHILTYPFMTVIRQLQSNHIGVPMMNQRSQNILDCIKRIKNEIGLTGFYRGFLGYAAVHVFLGVIMVDMNVRSGYFSMSA